MKSKTLLVLALTLSFANAFAQSAEERVLNTEPIDVDGYLSEKQVTDGELEQIRSEIRKQKNEVVLNKEKTKGFKELSKTTEKLSETTEEYLDEKKDAQKEIAEYNKKIKCLMEENPGADCAKYVRAAREEQAPVEAPVVQEIAVAQAAPATVSTVEMEPAAGMGDSAFETIKMLFQGGVTNYNGEKESLQADAAGLRIESNVNNRFSMGVGFNYAQLKTDDYANGSNIYGNNNYYGSQYYGAYGQKGREIQYKKMGIDLYGKFFITQGTRFRPYIGAGLGYNMADLKYSQNNPYQNTTFGYNYGNEAYKTNFATGTVSLGSEVMITRSFGLNFEGTYATGLGSSLSSQNSKNVSNSPDQRRLGQLADDIINSNSLSIFAGAVVVF